MRRRLCAPLALLLAAGEPALEDDELGLDAEEALHGDLDAAGGHHHVLVVLLGWDVAAVTFLALVWFAVAPMNAAATARSAASEDASRTEGEAVLLGAGTASLVAVGLTLIEAGRSTGAPRALLIALALASVVLAWASVHTIYALRYARLYYGEPAGGIDFNDDDPPEKAPRPARAKANKSTNTKDKSAAVVE